MSIRIIDNVEKTLLSDGVKLKDWQRKNLQQIEREVHRASEISPDEVMSRIYNELKKDGYFLKGWKYRDLKRRLF